MGLIGEEDLITKDSPNKEDTEWHEHAQSQSFAAITYVDQDITRFQHRLNVALMELVGGGDGRMNVLERVDRPAQRSLHHGGDGAGVVGRSPHKHSSSAPSLVPSAVGSLVAC